MVSNNYTFLLTNLILKDFKVRYRNMTFGIFWSLANPLVMMGVLTLVFTKILPNNSTKDFAVFVLCGLVPFNFYVLGTVTGTTSLLDNISLIKRAQCPRELIPVATVLANSLHFIIQVSLLIALALLFGYRANRYWVWLPVLWVCEVIFVCGVALATSALDVYFRDIRYFVESFNQVMFWLVPIFYSFAIIPQKFHLIYRLNPIAAVVLAYRYILLEAKSPPFSLLSQLSVVSLGALAVGFAIFGRLKRRFADYL